MEKISYFDTFKKVLDLIDENEVRQLHEALRGLKGRLFILGVGGSAANASHAVNDFRKILNIEAYAPTDNVAELTARTNDNGWDTVFADWLKVSRLNDKDMVLVLSVGGGSENASPNIVEALDYVWSAGAKIFGIVGRDGGYTAKIADGLVLIPTIDEALITPIAESMQVLILHMIVFQWLK